MAADLDDAIKLGLEWPTLIAWQGGEKDPSEMELAER